MNVEDLWHTKDGARSARHGQGSRWRARWRENGAQKARTFPTKAAAELWLSQHLAVPVAQRNPPTVGQLVQTWKATKAGLAPKTREAARTAARHVVDRWEHTPANEVRPSDVRVWLANLHGSESLKRQVFRCMKAALQLAVADGELARNPLDGIRAPQSGRREPRYLTMPELVALADAAGPDYRPLVLFLGLTGLRIGEAVALNVADVDTARGRVWVAAQKTDRGREVPVPPQVLALLSVQDRPRRAPLFVGERGARLNARWWREYRLAPAAEKIGRPELTPHMLRHAAASLAIASGADVKAVQRMLGHASARMTLDLYGHLFDAGLDDVAARLGEQLAES